MEHGGSERRWGAGTRGRREAEPAGRRTPAPEAKQLGAGGGLAVVRPDGLARGSDGEVRWDVAKELLCGGGTRRPASSRRPGHLAPQLPPSKPAGAARPALARAPGHRSPGGAAGLPSVSEEGDIQAGVQVNVAGFKLLARRCKKGCFFRLGLFVSLPRRPQTPYPQPSD